MELFALLLTATVKWKHTQCKFCGFIYQEIEKIYLDLQLDKYTLRWTVSVKYTCIA